MSSNQQHGAASAAAQGGQQQAAAPRPSQPAIVRATASYRVFSSSTFVHANITCTCHLLFTLMIALKFMGPLASAPWPALFIPEFVYHVLVRWLAQGVWYAQADTWVDTQLGPAPLEAASAYLHIKYADKRSRRLVTHRTDCLVAMLDGTAMLVVKVLVCWLLETGCWTAMPVSWAVIALPIWVVWPIGLVLQWRKPTNSWRCGGLRDLFFIFCVMLVAKLEGAPYNWAATFAVPWCVMGVCLLLATMWTIYLIAILIHPTYHIKLPQLAWGVSLCFAAPAVQLPSFLFAARYLDGNSSVTLLQIFLPALVSWALCVVGGNNLALALRRQERDRERRIDAGLAWAHNPDAADLRAERAAQDTQLLTLPEEQLVELVAQMLASGGVQPEYLVRVGENLWRPLQAKEAADVESGDGVGHAGGKRRTLHAKRTTAPRVSRDTGGEEDCSCVVELVVAAGAKGDEIGGGGASESTAHTCADSGSSRPPLLPAVGGAAAASAAASTAAGTAADTADGEPAECSICFSSDTPATSVLLGCGHGGYCRRCACLVAARQPRLCPQCRAPIKGMVTLDPQQAGGAPIGGLARVAGV